MNYPNMRCPALPYNGDNNFWVDSCNIKQEMPEHHRTCYPHCKKVLEGLGENKAGTTLRHHELQEEAIRVKAEIIDLYTQGVERPDIVVIVGRNSNYVFRCLREHGFTGRRKDSLRQKILSWMMSNPHASYHQVQEEFCCARSTAEKYRSEFNQGKRAADFGSEVEK